MTTPSAAGRGRLASEVYVTVKRQLLEGEYAAGQRISVEALKVTFGVSKQPIMDALRQLASEDLVEIVPQVGCVVRTYSNEDRDEFFEMFAVLEGTLAARAATHVTPELVARLEQTEQQVSALIADSNLQKRANEYRRLNRTFHELVHELAGSAIMSNLSRRLWDMSDFLVNTSGRDFPFGTATGERHHDHEAVIAAICAGDAASAKRLMEHHIRSTTSLAT
jgi:DNA-binding GntR family transcriptional regulator